ncbi:MAG: signal peptidase I [Chloroflexota bacterium]
MKSFFRDIVVTTLLALAIFFALQATLQSFVVVGNSMEPSFWQGQRLLVNRVAYFFAEPERGDVIIFHAPNRARADYIKRVIGLPGETIEIREGMVYIHSGTKVLPLKEPYLKDVPAYTFRSGKIPEGEYFVLGDNRNNSNDSHSGWLVQREEIIGKAWVSVWPLEQWGLAPNYSSYGTISAVNK